MLAATIISMFLFAVGWLLFTLVAYAILYGSIIFSYIFLWDDQTRHQICPKGLWHTIIHNE
jgi:hypothetical protein